jgi:hypothetical protein
MGADPSLEVRPLQAAVLHGWHVALLFVGADTTNPVLDWVTDAAGDVQQWAVEQGVVALQSAHAVGKVSRRWFHLGTLSITIMHPLCPIIGAITQLEAWRGMGYWTDHHCSDTTESSKCRLPE